MDKKIAFFDLDHTITICDTGQKFISRWMRHNPLYGWRFLVAPFIILAWKLRILKLHRVKEFFFSFIRGMTVVDIDQLASQFVEEDFTQLCKPQALKKVSALQQAGYTIVLASASPQFYVRYFAEKMDIQYFVATRYMVEDGKYTGQIAGQDCRGPEKISRIAEIVQYDAYDLGASTAFSDSKADLPMLSLVEDAWFVKRKQWQLFSAKQAVDKFRRKNS